MTFTNLSIAQIREFLRAGKPCYLETPKGRIRIFRVRVAKRRFQFGKVAWDRFESGTRMPDRADRNGESGKVVHAAEGNTGGTGNPNAEHIGQIEISTAPSDVLRRVGSQDFLRALIGLSQDTCKIGHSGLAENLDFGQVDFARENQWFC